MTQESTKKGEKRALWRAAATLERKPIGGKRRRRFPTVLFITDPQRTPDPVGVAKTLPRGAGVVYRGFGQPDSDAQAKALCAVARRRGLMILIGADEALAGRVGADGIHLPERSLSAARAIRRRRPRWFITGAAHSPAAIRAGAALGLDAILVSTIFPSASPSAKAPMGPLRLALLARRTQTRLIALGGVNGRTAGRLAHTHAAGFAAVEGLL